MPRNIFKGLTIVFFLIFLSGCAKNKVTMRAYVIDKARVDQEILGNEGYIYGTPKPKDRSQIKKTRKIYVLEFNEEADPNAEEDRVIEKKITDSPSSSYRQQKPHRTSQSSTSLPMINIVPIETEIGINEESMDTSAVTYTEYTVEKKDTLQKISKKFYDSYSKWPKIYEVNKSKIKDPNFIKPGTVLKIPSL